MKEPTGKLNLGGLLKPREKSVGPEASLSCDLSNNDLGFKKSVCQSLRLCPKALFTPQR